MSRSSIVGLLSFLSLLFVGLLLTPLPLAGRTAAALADLAHAPLCAGVAALALNIVRQKSKRPGLGNSATVWLGVALLGSLAESLQPLVGREASAADLAANLLGATAGVLWFHGAATRRRRVLAGLVLTAGSSAALAQLVDCGVQRMEMPRLASFEHALELSRWTAADCRIERINHHATHGSKSLRMEMGTGTYPGIALEWPVRDWSAYRELVFDFTVEDGPPVELIVKIEDAAHNRRTEDRFHRRLLLTPGLQSIHIPLADVAASPQGRQLDLRRVTFLQFFRIRPEQPRTLFLDNVRLE